MRPVFTICILLSCISAVAVARDIHVDNQRGDDRADGRPQYIAGVSGPVRSIAKGLRLAEAGDRIVVANSSQPYRETLSLTGSRHSGSAVNSFVIEGNGATLDGSGAISPDAWTHQTGDIYSFQPARLGYQQLFLAGRLAVRHPVLPDAAAVPRLEPLEWCLFGGKICLCMPDGQMPDAWQPSCCRLQTGMTLYHVRDVLIRNLTIQGYQIDGLSAADAARDIRIEHVTSRANGRSGVSVAGASQVELDDCALSENGDSQFRDEGPAQARLYHCQLTADTAPAIASVGGRILVDPGAGDNAGR